MAFQETTVRWGIWSNSWRAASSSPLWAWVVMEMLQEITWGRDLLGLWWNPALNVVGSCLHRRRRFQFREKEVEALANIFATTIGDEFKIICFNKRIYARRRRLLGSNGSFLVHWLGPGPARARLGANQWKARALHR